MDNGTIRELCDIVKVEVVEDLRQNMKSEESELIEQIVIKVTRILNAQYAPIVKELENKIIELQTEVCYLSHKNY